MDQSANERPAVRCGGMDTRMAFEISIRVLPLLQQAIP